MESSIYIEMELMGLTQLDDSISFSYTTSAGSFSSWLFFLKVLVNLFHFTTQMAAFFFFSSEEFIQDSHLFLKTHIRNFIQSALHTTCMYFQQKTKPQAVKAPLLEETLH